MRTLLAALAVAIPAVPAAAQVRPPVEGGRAESLGQPTPLKGTAGFGGSWASGGPRAAGALGVQRDLINPMLSLIALHGELFAEAWGEGVDAGVRARLISPFGRVGAGVEWRPASGPPGFLLSAFHPLRRGGVFADGSVLRLDWVPSRDRVGLGFEKPIRRNSHMGGSRPAEDRAPLPRAVGGAPAGTPPPAAAAPLAVARREAARIRMVTLPLGALQPGADSVRLHRSVEPLLDGREGHDGVAAAGDVVRFHDALDAAFAAATDDGAGAVSEVGRAVATGAREILLERVLLPYNALLGQTKRDDGVRGLGADARSAFQRWLHTGTDLPAARRDAALAVFEAVIDIVEENRAASRAEWRDSRFVWLPLQYALRPEQHDSQTELDALVERATGTRFTEGNFVSYVVNEQFQYQLSRTIRDAQDYHVLWTHDFRGLDGGREPDAMAYRHVLRSYLVAMTERVRAYDATGRFPAYIIILDQWFYELNYGRLWMTLLEDPLHHEVKLPPAYAPWQDSLAAAQRELRAAVAASSLLQAQAALYGSGWLRDLVRVQVNITNPADPSFWSRRVVAGLPLPDNMMRDHRKLVFYDLTEEDPYRGAAMFTGAGIAEHYSNLSWEDRTLLLRGPAALPLKAAARELLMRQGIAPERVPHGLQPRPRAADYDQQVLLAASTNEQPVRALQLHNVAGFGEKDVNVAKAVLYTLMPPGSVVKIPDSLWNSDFWGSALLGCALRGVRVLLIAPSAANSPVDQPGAAGRSHAMLARLLHARTLLGGQIDAAGGMLQIGLFASDLQVSDIPAKVRRVQESFERYPWMRALFGFPPSVLEGLAQLADMMGAMTMGDAGAPEFEFDPHPKLHLKANFFASREAWTLMSRPEWSDASYAYMQQRVSQLQSRTAAVGSDGDYTESIEPVGSGMVQDWYAGLDAAQRERVVFYTLMGSHNQNSRSMVIDAEVGMLLAHWPAIVPYIDLITLTGQTRWVDTVAELDALLPRDPDWKQRVAHWARLIM